MFPARSLTATAVLALGVFLGGCGSDAKSESDANEPAEALSPDEIKSQIGDLTGCSPYSETDPGSDSLAAAEYLCGSESAIGSDNYLFAFESPGRMEADLAEYSSEQTAAGNAVIVGDNWLLFTYSKSAVAALLDAGFELHRPMDPGYAVP